MEVFKVGVTELFGLNVNLVESVSTEIKNIDIKTNYMDFLFKTDNKDFVHFEFQTTNKKMILVDFYIMMRLSIIRKIVI